MSAKKEAMCEIVKERKELIDRDSYKFSLFKSIRWDILKTKKQSMELNALNRLHTKTILSSWLRLMLLN